MRKIGTLLALLALPGVALADCRARCFTPARHVDEVIVTTFAFIAPLFQVGVAPVVAASPPAGNDTLLAALRDIQGRLDRLERGPAAASPSDRRDAAAAPHVAIMAAKCAKCHDESTAAAQGGGLTLLKAGQVVELDAATVAQVIKDVYSGKMPKGGKCSDEEVARIIAGLPIKK